MKRVINTIGETVNIADINDEKFYAFRSYTSGVVGVIHRESFDRGNFKPYVTRCFTNGNSYSWAECQRLSDVINRLLDSKGNSIKVFEFETFKEMAAWLAENS